MANKNPLNYGSVCSGIEAATVAWQPLGWKAAWFAETEKFPSAVLAAHWPEVTNLGDMTRIAAAVRSGEVSAPDVLVGGTPCQAFSVSGLRLGLADERGQLTLSFVELANAIDQKRRKYGKPAAIIVWENVTGVFSSADNAFGHFLGALAGAGCALQPSGKRWSDAGVVSGPTRTVAWRVLNAEYFGLAQSRNRVFVVAGARPGFDPGAVLFESHPVPPRPADTNGKPEKSQPSPDAGAEDERRYCADAIPATTGTLIACYDGTGNQDMKMRGGLIVERQPRLRVRRLTPEECERLQGFPVGHTAIPWHCTSPAHRYRAIGNAMPVPVMRWVGTRIQQALDA